MRYLLWPGLLAVLLTLTGCSSPTCDMRGRVDICEIHHSFMRAEIISNTPQPPPSQAYLEARIKSFVHAKPFFLPEQCKKCMVNICDDCVKAEQEWKREHPGQ